MNHARSKLNWGMLALLTALFLPVGVANAQVCTGLPAVPDGTITTTQDRDQMMCQLGLTFPNLPVRQGTAWPWNDPTAPTNAWPKVLTNPSGNWTDAQSHTIVRTAWGNWHTYDADPMYEPPATLHYPDPSIVNGPYNGGAMSGVGAYGPLSNPRYPDIELLQLKDGAPVQLREDWWIKRRPEIFNFVQNELYGDNLNSFLPHITWTVTQGDPYNTTTPATGTVVGTDGNTYAYNLETLAGTVDTSSYPALRHTPVIVARCYMLPSKKGTRTPVVVTYGEAALQYTAQYGINVCAYNPAPFSFPPFFVDNTPPLQPDSGGANLSDYVIGLKNQGNWRKPDDPGALVAWAWGISRLIDYFATDPDFDADKVAVEGHSRYGKATLVTAAYDNRIVAAFPSCGGELGTSWARRAYGETFDFVTSSTSEYHWVAGNAMTYAGPIVPYDGNPAHTFPRKVQNLDVDVHSVMSLISPRAVFTNGGTDTPQGNGDAWQDPRGMYLAGAVSSEVWNFLGWPGQIIPQGTVFTAPGSPGASTCVTCGPAEATGGTPPFDTAFIDGTVAWRRHSAGHTPTPDWPSFALFASRYLNDGRPQIAVGQSFVLGTNVANVVGTVQATDPDSGDTLKDWQVKGGTGAYKFAINSDTGEITIADAASIDYAGTSSYTLTLMVGDGKLPSHDAVVTINIPNKLDVCHNGHTISISKHAVQAHVAIGDAVGSCP
jgi:hypothetical protein